MTDLDPIIILEDEDFKTIFQDEADNRTVLARLACFILALSRAQNSHRDNEKSARLHPERTKAAARFTYSLVNNTLVIHAGRTIVDGILLQWESGEFDLSHLAKEGVYRHIAAELIPGEQGTTRRVSLINASEAYDKDIRSLGMVWFINGKWIMSTGPPPTAPISDPANQPTKTETTVDAGAAASTCLANVPKEKP